MPGWQCFWKVKEGKSFSLDDKPYIMHWIDKGGGAYQFILVLPTWEYPDLVKVSL